MPVPTSADDHLSRRHRYVVLGLADPRSPWLVRVGRWAAEGSAPVELIRTSSPGELRALLDTRRRFSSVLVDGRQAGAGRDLLGVVRRIGCVPIVVDGAGAMRDWTGLGAAAVLTPDFDRDELTRLLAVHSRPVGVRLVRHAGDLLERPSTSGATVVVTGPPDGHRSAVAIALAGGLGRDPARPPVALVDFCLDADLAARLGVDPAAGVQELIEGHRLGDPAVEAIEQLLVTSAGFDLLAGLRRPEDWTSLGTASSVAAVAGLRRIRRTLVIATDPDVSGELDTGSLDLEDRNALARAAIGEAHVLVVVGGAGAAGLDRLRRTVARIGRSLQPGAVTVPVIVRSARDGTEPTATHLAGSTSFADGARTVATPVLVAPVVAESLPAASLDQLVRAVTAALDRVGRIEGTRTARRVRPGELGWWTDPA